MRRTADTILDLVVVAAEAHPGAPAIEAPGRAPLTYAGLRVQIERTIRSLQQCGIGRSDRVALVVPDGPDMVVACLSAAACATAAPLNGAYSASEFDFYLGDLAPRILVVPAETDSPAADVARARGIPIVRLEPAPGREAGCFSLSTSLRVRRGASAPAVPDDVALVLHTSGTTSRPKIVPLTHHNLCASAHNIRTSLRLAAGDRCLNVTPLFHIHGLVGAVLSSVAAGGSVVCPPGFHAARFFEWLATCQPTWYTAVPAMHQAIVERAPSNRDAIGRHRLRFIRSCSSALPVSVLRQLEELFGVPVVEAYGMTETSHQIAINPLPPGTRKPGSVGLPTGLAVATMDESGSILPPGVTGEIVVRGDTVTRGYEGDPDASRTAFVGEWLRTGDQGYLDADGYIHLTGRLKELIVRGGEKISPREVDEVLLEHPAVAQCVAFPIPHASLGEEVGAAVVLRDGLQPTELELRRFAFTRLAHFKVPTRIVLVDALPKGPTGKVRRADLVTRLGVVASAPPPRPAAGFRSPASPLERALAAIWAEVLGVTRVGADDNFFYAGGDSMLAVELVRRVRQAFDLELSLLDLFEAPTVAGLALKLGATGMPTSPIVAVQPHGRRRPFFMAHANMGGNGFHCFDLARHLGPEQPLYALSPHGVHGEALPRTVEDMAARYLDALLAVQPAGPYLLAGTCISGVIVFELARQLEARGERVDALALVELPAYHARLQNRVLRVVAGLVGAVARLSPGQTRETVFRLWDWLDRVASPIRTRAAPLDWYWRYYRKRVRDVARMTNGERLALLTTRLGQMVGAIRGRRAPAPRSAAAAVASPAGSGLTEFMARREAIRRHYLRAVAAYVPQRYSGTTLYIYATDGTAWAERRTWWRATPTRQVRMVSGDHDTYDGLMVSRHLSECLSSRGASPTETAVTTPSASPPPAPATAATN